VLAREKNPFGPSAAKQSRHKRQREGYGAHRQQREYRRDTTGRSQEDRDCHDRQELACGASGDDVLAEGSLEHVVIAQDG
jgi:hypothetical protein